MYKIAKDNLAALFQLIADNQELYLPVKNAGQTNYAAWTKEAEVDLDTLKTVKSAKDAFFPQSENLYTVRKENKKLKIEPEKLKEQNFVVFGMKACDVKYFSPIRLTASMQQDVSMEQSLLWHATSRKKLVSVKCSALMQLLRRRMLQRG